MKPQGLTYGQWLAYNALFLQEHVLGHKLYRKIYGRAEGRLMSAVGERVKLTTEKDDGRFRILEYQKGEYPERLYHHHLPVIYRGAASDWNCCKNWTFDHFSERFGNKYIGLINNEGLVKDSSQPLEITTMSRFIEELKANSGKYLKFSRLVQDNSELKNDMDLNWLKGFMSKASFGEVFYFFIGGSQTLTPIHNGMSRTIFIHASGRKKWIFYAPEDRIFLGARPERTNYFYTKADADNLNDLAFPLLKYAKRHEVILEPGDVLYFPPLVWHQVENLTETIGVAYKFADIPSSFRVSKTMALLYFLSTKPYIWQSTSHLWNKETHPEEEETVPASY